VWHAAMLPPQQDLQERVQMKLFKTSSPQRQSLRRVIEEADAAMVATEERASAQEMLEKVRLKRLSWER